jgi:hypothetical protein
MVIQFTYQDGREYAFDTDTRKWLSPDEIQRVNAASRPASGISTTAEKKFTVQDSLDLMKWVISPSERPYDTTPTRRSIIEELPSNYHPELSSNPDMWDYSKRHKRI